MNVGGTTIATSFTPSVAVYNIVVNVVRVAKTNTARGLAEVPTNIVTNMPARIRWSRGKERLQFDKVTYLRDAVLRCRKPAGVTITTKDRISFNGESFEIVSVVDFRNLGRLLVIDIKRIE